MEVVIGVGPGKPGLGLRMGVEGVASEEEDEEDADIGGD